MRRIIPLVLLATTLALAGCQSHEAKVVDLQKEHDQLSAQFRKDCYADYQASPPRESQKCKDEDQKLGDLEKQIKAGQLKH
jgi:hypothetical protein